jgi:hypothetical protein
MKQHIVLGLPLYGIVAGTVVSANADPNRASHPVMNYSIHSVESLECLGLNFAAIEARMCLSAQRQYGSPALLKMVNSRWFPW